MSGLNQSDFWVGDGGGGGVGGAGGAGDFGISLDALRSSTAALERDFAAGAPDDVDADTLAALNARKAPGERALSAAEHARVVAAMHKHNNDAGAVAAATGVERDACEAHMRALMGQFMASHPVRPTLASALGASTQILRLFGGGLQASIGVGADAAASSRARGMLGASAGFESLLAEQFAHEESAVAGGADDVFALLDSAATGATSSAAAAAANAATTAIASAAQGATRAAGAASGAVTSSVDTATAVDDDLGAVPASWSAECAARVGELLDSNTKLVSGMTENVRSKRFDDNLPLMRQFVRQLRWVLAATELAGAMPALPIKLNTALLATTVRLARPPEPTPQFAAAGAGQAAAAFGGAGAAAAAGGPFASLRAKAATQLRKLEEEKFKEAAAAAAELRAQEAAKSKKQKKRAHDDADDDADAGAAAGDDEDEFQASDADDDDESFGASQKKRRASTKRRK